ncbi:MAG: Gfo/Idh/MocA family protein [Inquilinaceae bacterium]
MSPPLTVAVVGAGYFSRFHHDAWHRIDGVRPIAACDQKAEAREALAALYPDLRIYDDAAAMIAAERPDLLDIATPPPTHLSLIRLAAEAGCAIICQKPFTTSLENARSAAALAVRHGVTLAVHENFRFQPWYREVARLLADGLVGPIYSLYFRLRPGDGQGPAAYLDRQPYFQTMRRFLIHETGIHFIDVFRFLVGDVAWVWADLRRLNPAIAGEDSGLVVLGLADGARAVLDGNRLVDHAARNPRLTLGELTVEGARGTLSLDGDGMLWHRPMGEPVRRPLPFSWQDRGFGGDCVAALQDHVVRHLREGTPLENDVESYLRNLEIEEALYRAAEEGCRIVL